MSAEKKLEGTSGWRQCPNSGVRAQAWCIEPLKPWQEYQGFIEVELCCGPWSDVNATRLLLMTGSHQRFGL